MKGPSWEKKEGKQDIKKGHGDFGGRAVWGKAAQPNQDGALKTDKTKYKHRDR